MSQKSQHTRSFVAEIITYAHFGPEKKIELHKSGTGGSPFYDFFSHTIAYFLVDGFPYYVIFFFKIREYLCYSFLKCYVCAREAQKVDQGLHYKQKRLLVLADY